MYFLLEKVDFHCYVSLPEGIHLTNWGVLMFWYFYHYKSREFPGETPIFFDITFETPIDKRWDVSRVPVWSFVSFFQPHSLAQEDLTKRRSQDWFITLLWVWIYMVLLVTWCVKLICLFWCPTKKSPWILNSPMELADFFFTKKEAAFRVIKKSPLKKGDHAKFCQFKSPKGLEIFWRFFAFEELDESRSGFFHRK